MISTFLEYTPFEGVYLHSLPDGNIFSTGHQAVYTEDLCNIEGILSSKMLGASIGATNEATWNTDPGEGIHLSDKKSTAYIPVDPNGQKLGAPQKPDEKRVTFPGSLKINEKYDLIEQTGDAACEMTTEHIKISSPKFMYMNETAGLNRLDETAILPWIPDGQFDLMGGDQSVGVMRGERTVAFEKDAYSLPPFPDYDEVEAETNFFVPRLHKFVERLIDFGYIHLIAEGGSLYLQAGRNKETGRVKYAVTEDGVHGQGRATFYPENLYAVLDNGFDHEVQATIEMRGERSPVVIRPSKSVAWAIMPEAPSGTRAIQNIKPQMKTP